MTKKQGAALATGLVAVLLIGVTVLPSAAQEPTPPPIATEFLTGRAVFTDAVEAKFKVKRPGEGATVVNSKDASRTVVARFTVQPGAQFPWHTHPGPVTVNVTQGELVVRARRRLLATRIPGRDRVRRPWSRPRPHRLQPDEPADRHRRNALRSARGGATAHSRPGARGVHDPPPGRPRQGSRVQPTGA